MQQTDKKLLKKKTNFANLIQNRQTIKNSQKNCILAS